DEPSVGEDLHPRPHERDDLPGEVQAVVACLEGTEDASHHGRSTKRSKIDAARASVSRSSLVRPPSLRDNHASRRFWYSSCALRPASVIATWTSRPSGEVWARTASPRSSSPATMRVTVGALTRSMAASSPTVIGPEW